MLLVMPSEDVYNVIREYLLTLPEAALLIPDESAVWVHDAVIGIKDIVKKLTEVSW